MFLWEKLNFWSSATCDTSDQGWGQTYFIKYKYKYKYVFFGVSNTNTNTNTPAKIWSNANTNTNTVHQIQIQIQIRTEADTKLPPFYRWHIQIHSIVRKLFYLFKFQWFFSKSPIYNEHALIQIMAWNWVCNKPLSDQFWPGLLVHKCITPPKWVNVKCRSIFECGMTPVLS